MHSIVGQGKVEQVLASRPEDRRAFVEEAAGLGKFKRRRHRAELKLARVALQVERARDVEEEVRKRLRPLALQATAAERAEKLALEIAALRARIAQLDLADSGAKRAEVEERRDAAAFSRRGAQARLEGLLADRARAEEELSDAAGRREAAVAARYRLQGGSRAARAPRRSRPSALLERFRGETAGAADESSVDRAISTRSSSKRSRRPRPRAAQSASAPPWSSAPSSSRSAFARSSKHSPSRRGSLRRRARSPRTARASRSRVSTSSRAPSAPSPRRCGRARRRSSPTIPWSGSRSLQRARAAGLGSLTVLTGVSPQELVREYPVVPLERLLDVTVASVTPEGFGYDPARGELWFVGETAEAVLLELQGRRSALAREASELEEQVAEAARAPSETAERARVAEAALGRAPRRRASSARRRDCSVASSSLRLRSRRRSQDAQRLAARFEAPLRARVDAGSTRAGVLGEELRTLGATEVGLRTELDEAAAALTAAEVEIARIDAEVIEAMRRLGSLGDVEPAEGDDRDELAIKVERLEARRVTLGQVNPLAREEYEAEKERLADLSAQREDLERSLEELDALCAELTATVERRFAETFAAVAEHFEDVASTLFPGGEGRLRLVEPEGDERRARGRGRAAARGKAHHAPLAPLRRREGAGRDLVPVRALPRAAVRVLPPRRGRGRSRRCEHRALRRAPTPLFGSRAVRRGHPPEEDDGGRGYPLRRDDGAGRRVAGGLAAPPAAPEQPLAATA